MSNVVDQRVYAIAVQFVEDLSRRGASLNNALRAGLTLRLARAIEQAVDDERRAIVKELGL